MRALAEWATVSPMSGRTWAVVGGGLLGATLALRLAEAGERVTLYESAPELGGLASAWKLDDVLWDRHYHVTLLSDGRTRNLLAELGVESDMRWVVTRTGCYTDGKLYSVSNAVEFLKFPPLRLLDRLPAGLDGAVRVARSATGSGSRRSASRSGSAACRETGPSSRFWRPLLRSKLGDDYRHASAAFIWAVIQRLYAARRSGHEDESCSATCPADTPGPSPG